MAVSWCVCVWVCVTSPLRSLSNPVCALPGPFEDRESLAFACNESHGWMKVWGPLVYICVLSQLSPGLLPLSSLPPSCSACFYPSWPAVRWRLNDILQTAGNTHTHIFWCATFSHRWLWHLFLMAPLYCSSICSSPDWAHMALLLLM